MRALIAAAVAALAACCPEAHDLALTGDATPPADTAAVIAAAQAQCDRPIVGTIEFRAEWHDEVMPVGDQPGRRIAGECAWAGGGCPMDAWVTVPATVQIAPDPDVTLRPSLADRCRVDGVLHDSAVCTALAHEIGHWCLQSEDEAKVQRWADTVNLAVIGE